ncbi:hypothetical protein [Nonomuraea endophytica]|uniref:hypothetical protein n=1 Tax=Nonomuraea endophytica TaxID=714136 RepID=UPI0037CADDC8
MATPWMDDDDLDDEPVVHVEWTEVDPARFDRSPRVVKNRRIDGVLYELCARAGLHWVRRFTRGDAVEVAIFDGPMGSEKDAEELWQKIMSREAA